MFDLLHELAINPPKRDLTRQVKRDDDDESLQKVYNFTSIVLVANYNNYITFALGRG